MFDTMTLTKIVGGFCGTLLVFLLGVWGGETIYHVGGEHGGEHEQAYAVEVPEGEGGEAEEDAPDFEEVFASADASAGERVFGKCKACHRVDGTNATGPHLNGVVNRPVDSVDGICLFGRARGAFRRRGPRPT